MSKFITQADAQKRDAKAQYNALVGKFLDDVYNAHPTIVRCTANDKMLVEIVQRFAGNTVVPTLELFHLAQDENEGFIGKTVASESIEDRRENLVDEVMELIRTGGPRLTDFDLKNLRGKFMYFSVQELEAKKSELVEKHRLAKLRPNEIRQGLANARASAQPQAQRVVLPAEHTQASIRRADSNTIRSLIRQFGASAVNDRLFGRS